MDIITSDIFNNFNKDYDYYKTTIENDSLLYNKNYGYL